MTTASRIAIALVAGLVITGCAARGVHVAQLKDQPARYYNREISLNGTVTRSWKLPLVPFQLYSIDDGTGTITVLSNQGRTPAQGTRVHVTGRVTEIASFGSASLGLHIDETNHKIRY